MHKDVTVRDLVHDGVHEFLHLDGKIFRTIALLALKPGALTVEFLRGRRARYISPLRLYLTCSILYFALAALGAGPSADWKVTSRDAPTPEVREAIEKVREKMDELRRELPHQVPRLMFLLMPTFALFTWVFYRRAQPYYVPHLYYSIHFHAFLFLLFAVATAIGRAGTVGEVAGGTLGLAMFPYHYVALRRVFGGTKTQTAWKGTAIAVLYSLLLGLIWLAVLYWLVVRPAIGDRLLHPS